METQTEIKGISERQKDYIKGLCKRQNLPEIDTKKMTSFEANEVITKLKSRTTTPQYVKKDTYTKPVEEVVQDKPKPTHSYVVDNSQNATIGMCFKIVYQAWAMQNKVVQNQRGEFVRQCVEALDLFKTFKTELVKAEYGAEKPLIFQNLVSDAKFAEHLKRVN